MCHNYFRSHQELWLSSAVTSLITVCVCVKLAYRQLGISLRCPILFIIWCHYIVSMFPCFLRTFLHESRLFRWPRPNQLSLNQVLKNHDVTTFYIWIKIEAVLVFMVAENVGFSLCQSKLSVSSLLRSLGRWYVLLQSCNTWTKVGHCYQLHLCLSCLAVTGSNRQLFVSRPCCALVRSVWPAQSITIGRCFIELWRFKILWYKIQWNGVEKGPAEVLRQQHQCQQQLV